MPDWKTYLKGVFDTALVQGDEGAIFENFVALSLLKSIYARADSKAENCSLHYLHTKDAYEVDFAVINNKEVKVIIEAKLSEQDLSKPLRFFHKKYQYPAIQLSRYIKKEYKEEEIENLNALSYLSSLYL